MDSLNDNAFGDWLRQELADRKISMSRFARLAGVSDGAVKLWVQGERNISEPYCDAIADALGVSRNEVRCRAGRPPTPDDPVAAGGATTIGFSSDGSTPVLEKWNEILPRLSITQQQAILEMLETLVEE